MAHPSTGPLIPRRRLGAAFRELRDARGQTLQQAAKALMFSPSKLSRIENGLAGEPNPRDVRDLINHFELTDTPRAAQLEELAEAGRVPGWWQLPPYDMPSRLDTFIAFESAATGIDTYVPAFAPGLLQTPAYARAVLQATAPHLSPDDVDHQVELRLERQRQLRTGRQPPQQLYVIPETVLLRWAGNPVDMRQQLTTLIEANDDPFVDLHVIPFSAGMYDAIEMSTITIFELDEIGEDTVVGIERVQYTEFLDKSATVEKYRAVIERLSNYWLGSSESSAFIERIRHEKWQGS